MYLESTTIRFYLDTRVRSTQERQRILKMVKIIEIYFIFNLKFQFINLNVSVNDLIGHTARLSSPEFYSDDRGGSNPGLHFPFFEGSTTGPTSPLNLNNLKRVL